MPTDDNYYNIHDCVKQICTLFYAPVYEWYWLDMRAFTWRPYMRSNQDTIEHAWLLKQNVCYLNDGYYVEFSNSDAVHCVGGSEFRGSSTLSNLVSRVMGDVDEIHGMSVSDEPKGR